MKLKTPMTWSVGLVVAVAAAYIAHAGTEKVSFPTGFETTFTRYEVVDRADRNKTRFMYMNSKGWEAAVAGEPLPYGSVVVMEDHKIRMIDETTPVVDSQGRLISMDETTNVFVMEKRAGWGQDYSDDVRNGEWEYAWFAPDGTRADKPMTACFECHKAQAAEDFTFTAFKAIAAQK